MSEQMVDRAFLFELLDELIAVNSVNPDVGGGPGEGALAQLLFERLQAINGLEVRKQQVADGRWNVIAVLKGSGGGRSLMLNGHMDTVGVEGMTIEPFKAVERDGAVHGRGASDMKSGIAGIVAAAKALAESEKKLRGDLMLSFVVDEEHLSIGMSKLVEEFRADAAIVGEPTNLRIGTAHKGFIWIEIETKGRAAHGSVPEQGIDAITHATRIVPQLSDLQLRLRRREHPLLGPAKVHTSTIQGGTHWSIIPDRCLLRLERRTLPGENSAHVMQEIEQLLDGLRKEYADFNAVARKVFERPPLETNPNQPIVQALRQAAKEVTGVEENVVGLPYWTDGAILADSRSVPTCIFGPGDINVAHSPDEYVEAQQVQQAANIYAQVVGQFCA